MDEHVTLRFHRRSPHSAEKKMSSIVDIFGYFPEAYVKLKHLLSTTYDHGTFTAFIAGEASGSKDSDDGGVR